METTWTKKGLSLELVGTLAAQDYQHRTHENGEICPEGVVADVFHAQPDALLVRQIAAALHLPRAGYAGLNSHEVALELAVTRGFIGSDHARTDQTHLAAQ